jgi:hypothetical protein
LGEIGEDIIFPVRKGRIESAGPEGDVNEGMFFFVGVGIVVEVVDPGDLHRTHRADEVVDGSGVIAIADEGILQAGFSDGVFIDIGEGVGDQFKREPVERAVGEFNGKWLFCVGMPIYFFDAVEGRLVLMIIVFDVERGAGAGLDQEEEEEQLIWAKKGHTVLIFGWWSTV